MQACIFARGDKACITPSNVEVAAAISAKGGDAGRIEGCSKAVINQFNAVSFLLEFVLSSCLGHLYDFKVWF